MLTKIAIYISNVSFVRKSKYIKKFLKFIAKITSRIIYGEYKKISIANKYKFLIDSSFVFRKTK